MVAKPDIGLLNQTNPTNQYEWFTRFDFCFLWVITCNMDKQGLKTKQQNTSPSPQNALQYH